MTDYRNLSRRSPVLAALAGALILIGPACSGRRNPAASGETPKRSTPAVRTAEAQADDAVRQREVVRKLEDDIGRLGLQLLEREAWIVQLDTRLAAQQRALDEAVQEVVRLKAKHRGLETRAEAAAEIAEAEIALKGFRDQETTGTRPDLAKAEALVKRAAEELGRQNFSGALYLVEQAKAQIKLGSVEAGDPPVTDVLEGEKPFAVPIPLVVVAKSNLREGPGQDFKVLAVLEQGTEIRGLSSKGLWVRVESKEGLSGWLKLNLVAAS